VEEIARVAAELEAGRDDAAAPAEGAEGAAEGAAAIAINGVLPQHKRKSGVVWSAYNLSEEKPSCTVCGNVPSPTGGTSNYWSHLFVHHRAIWLKLKQKAGALTGSGEAELSALLK